nr:Asp-tRNA(Asn)/Glu-tRNA(Gln) amidotransferase subunit GatC [Mycoplasmopsis bovis]
MDWFKHFRIEWLKEIDTSNVEPLSHINENRFIDFLRDDVEDNSLVSIKKHDLLSNACWLWRKLYINQ